jgi:hypothetical protein
MVVSHVRCALDLELHQGITLVWLFYQMAVEPDILAKPSTEWVLEHMKRDNRFCKITQIAEHLRAWRSKLKSIYSKRQNITADNAVIGQHRFPSLC